MKSGDSKISDLVESLKKNPDNTALRAELAKLKADKQSKYELMTDSERSAYFSEKRKEIMSDIDDEDVASTISKEYTSYRSTE